ncbi:MAG TPA: type II toxin-antitoxin system prevent-host-death family antitoxin [Gemmatimonadales bacterium]|jgi:prevent-host-death family protein
MTQRRTSIRETVTLYDAKTNLSELVERAAGGEEIVIAKRGKPKALLVPLERVHPLRRPGLGRGQWHLRKDFDAPLPEGVLGTFEG